MFQTVLRIVAKGYKKYPDNPYFGRLLSALDEAEDIPEVMDVFVVFSKDVSGNAVEFDSGYKAYNADYRPTFLMMDAFKAYPSDPDGIKYCVDFSNDDGQHPKPITTIVLGGNGSGKTSVYCALEYMATHRCPIANVFGFSGKTCEAVYMQNVNSLVGFDLEMYDVSGYRHVLPDQNAPELCTPAFFCSQADIQEYEGRGMTKEFLFTQLGRLSLFQLSHVLHEIQRVTILLNQARSINYTQPKSDEEKKSLDERKKNILSNVKQILSLGGGGVSRYTWATDKAKDYIVELVEYIDREIEDVVKNFHDTARKIVPLLVNPYLLDDENIEVELWKNNLEISPVLVDTNGEGTDPMLYFNTFRAKLFILSLKIAFAFTSKIIDKLNFPIVIDDIFDASDFHNKDEIRNFFRNVIRTHDEIEELHQYPIQLICLTQDQMVGWNVYSGIEKELTADSVKYIRLFHPAEATQDDVVELPLPDDESAKIKVRLVSENIKPARL